MAQQFRTLGFLGAGRGGSASAHAGRIGLLCLVAVGGLGAGCAVDSAGPEEVDSAQNDLSKAPATGSYSGESAAASSTAAASAPTSQGGAVGVAGGSALAPTNAAQQVLDQVPPSQLPQGFENDGPVSSVAGFSMVQVESGEGWQEISLTGATTDPETGVARQLNDERVIVVTGEVGATNAPIPLPEVKSQLVAEMRLVAEPETVGTATQLKTGAQSAEVQGVSTANQIYVPSPEPVYYLHKATLDQMRVASLNYKPIEGGTKYRGGCSDPIETKVFHKDFSFSKDLHKADEAGAFQGTLDMHFGFGGFGLIELEYKRKRASVAGECFTYGFGFRKLLLNGQVWGDASVDLQGKLLKQWDYSKRVATPEITKQVFWVGPVPVVVGLDVPIDMGLKASATGDANFESSIKGWGAFTTICTTSGCNSWHAAGLNTEDLWPDFAIQANLKARPWAQAAVRAYLFHPDVARAQVGVRPFVEADIHGYAGNQCGDGDRNGTNEFVSAAMIDAEAGFDITAEADLLGLVDWSGSWEVYRKHLLFEHVSLATSSAEPMVWVELPSSGTSTTTGGNGVSVITGGTTGTVATENTAQYYRKVNIQMRPCWPYTERVTYKVSFDGGAETTWSGAPGTPLVLTPGFNTSGNHSVRVTAVSDAHQRELGTSVTRTFNIPRPGTPTLPAFPTPTKQR